MKRDSLHKIKTALSKEVGALNKAQSCASSLRRSHPRIHITKSALAELSSDTASIYRRAHSNERSFEFDDLILNSPIYRLIRAGEVDGEHKPFTDNGSDTATITSRAATLSIAGSSGSGSGLSAFLGINRVLEELYTQSQSAPSDANE
jgi:hypothetical protein